MSQNKIKSKEELKNVNSDKVDIESLKNSIDEKKKALKNNIIQK